MSSQGQVMVRSRSGQGQVKVRSRQRQVRVKVNSLCKKVVYQSVSKFIFLGGSKVPTMKFQASLPPLAPYHPFITPHTFNAPSNLETLRG